MIIKRSNLKYLLLGSVFLLPNFSRAQSSVKWEKVVYPQTFGDNTDVLEWELRNSRKDSTDVHIEPNHYCMLS